MFVLQEGCKLVQWQGKDLAFLTGSLHRKSELHMDVKQDTVAQEQKQIGYLQSINSSKNVTLPGHMWSRSPYWWQNVSSANNRCLTLQSSDTESLGLKITKAITSIPDYLVLHSIFPSVLSSLHFQVSQIKGFPLLLHGENAPTQGIVGKSIPKSSEPTADELSIKVPLQSPLLSSTVSVLGDPNFIKVCFSTCCCCI